MSKGVCLIDESNTFNVGKPYEEEITEFNRFIAAFDRLEKNLNIQEIETLYDQFRCYTLFHMHSYNELNGNDLWNELTTPNRRTEN